MSPNRVFHIVLASLLSLVFSVGTIVSAEQDEATAATVMAKVREKYQSIQCMKADFKQLSYNASLGKELVSTGVYYTDKSGKVKWDYTTPEPQHILLSGGKLLLYIPKEKQLFVSEAGEVEELKAVLDLLGGECEMQERFKMRLITGESQKEAERAYVVRVVPRKPLGNLLRLDLSVDKKTHVVVATDYFDVYGNRTRVFFSNVDTSPKLEKSTFVLDIPDDVVTMDGAGNPLPNYSPAEEGAQSTDREDKQEG